MRIFAIKRTTNFGIRGTAGKQADMSGIMCIWQLETGPAILGMLPVIMSNGPDNISYGPQRGMYSTLAMPPSRIY